VLRMLLTASTATGLLMVSLACVRYDTPTTLHTCYVQCACSFAAGTARTIAAEHYRALAMLSTWQDTTDAVHTLCSLFQLVAIYSAHSVISIALSSYVSARCTRRRTALRL
jgi:hypothetical protein